MQRVPFMIHIPGQENGGIFEQYGGEIDVMPTLLHLAGIDSKKYLLFGSDLFSKDHDQTVAFRNENFITPKYTVVGSTIYENSNGNRVTHPLKKYKNIFNPTHLPPNQTVSQQNLGKDSSPNYSALVLLILNYEAL